MLMTETARRFDRAAFFEDLGYAPHPGQAEIHACDRPWRIVACGVRWGKTMASAMEGLAAAIGAEEAVSGVDRGADV
jgi:hypothetical protein